MQPTASRRGDSDDVKDGGTGRGPVAVVVVTYNSADVVAGLLESLPAGLGDVPAQVVVVDNGSRDDTLEVVRSTAPDATVVATGRNGGYAAGINAGVAEAGNAVAILVLNPDVRLGPGCVPELLRALDRTGAGVVVPRLDDAAGQLIHSRRREPTLRRTLADALLGAERAGRIANLGEVVTDPGAYRVESATDWAEGSTQLISAACWRAAGPWDESYFLYSERRTSPCVRATGGTKRGSCPRLTPCTSRAVPQASPPSGVCWSPTGCGCTVVATLRWRPPLSGPCSCCGRPAGQRSARRPAGRH